MNHPSGKERIPTVYHPGAETCYPLETTARLAGVERRTLLVYCRHGMIRPVRKQPGDVWLFTDETVHTIRRLEQLRQLHGVNLTGLRLIMELQHRLERLEQELRFLREG